MKSDFQFSTSGLSHVGLVRSRNEDRWADLSTWGFWVVADGMGGHKGGDVAAEVTVETLCKHIQKNFPRMDGEESVTAAWAAEHLMKALESANDAVLMRGRGDASLRGMGSTVVALYACGEEMILAHVGDSRIYLLRDERLEQLTQDHSLRTQLVNTGQISEEEADAFIYKHVITRAVGTRREVRPTIGRIHMEKGDRFLLCSDGLSDQLSADRIRELLSEGTKALVDGALEAGGEDNITVVVVDVT